MAWKLSGVLTYCPLSLVFSFGPGFQGKAKLTHFFVSCVPSRINTVIKQKFDIKWGLAWPEITHVSGNGQVPRREFSRPGDVLYNHRIKT